MRRNLPPSNAFLKTLSENPKEKTQIEQYLLTVSFENCEEKLEKKRRTIFTDCYKKKKKKKKKS